MFLILEHFKLPQQYFLGQQNEKTLRSLTKDDLDSFWDGFSNYCKSLCFQTVSWNFIGISGLGITEKNLKFVILGSLRPHNCQTGHLTS